jgi:pimeloyl-ACP methyl ester carboxylesterase
VARRNEDVLLEARAGNFWISNFTRKIRPSLGMEKVIESADQTVIRYYEYQPKSRLNKETNYLICCPGWLCSPVTLGESLSDVVDLTGFTLIVIEWRGHGKSIVPFFSPVTISLLSEDLKILIQHLLEDSPKSRISLLGHSMGVNVIWRYISRFGETNVDRYIFLDQPAAITGSIHGETLGYRKEWRVHSKPEVYFLAFLCFAKNFLVIPIFSLVSSKMMRKFLAYARKCSSLACARLLIDTTFTDNTQRVSLVTRPCLVYGGKASFVNPNVARWISQMVRGSVQLLIYPKPYGTHFPFLEVEGDKEHVGPKRFIKDLTEYLMTDTP